MKKLSIQFITPPFSPNVRNFSPISSTPPPPPSSCNYKLEVQRWESVTNKKLRKSNIPRRLFLWTEGLFYSLICRSLIPPIFFSQSASTNGLACMHSWKMSDNPLILDQSVLQNHWTKNVHHGNPTKLTVPFSNICIIMKTKYVIHNDKKKTQTFYSSSPKTLI